MTDKASADMHEAMNSPAQEDMVHYKFSGRDYIERGGVMHAILEHEEIPHLSAHGVGSEASMIISVPARFKKTIEDRIQEWYESIHQIHTEVWAHHEVRERT